MDILVRSASFTATAWDQHNVTELRVTVQLGVHTLAGASAAY